MLVEFFLSKSVGRRIWAWTGLAAIVCHALLKAYVKYLLNDWFRLFYDAGGAASELGSGDDLEAGREEMVGLLLRFAKIAAVLVVAHPLFKYVCNVWILSWRVALVNSYLERWPCENKTVENAAQRVHEDTQRMARGLQECGTVVLDAILTLVVFVPVLIDVGSHVKTKEGLPSWWLLAVVVAVAAAGAFVSVVLGWSLVDLEVENQKVEADLRKKLVLREEAGSELSPDAPVGEELVASFRSVVVSLRKNYKRLYGAFAVFSLWLGAFEQAVVILPYAIAAPRLFAEGPTRITLGLVSQTSHAFANVFESMNLLSSNWVAVTDFLSTWRRLRQWEAVIGGFPPAERPLMHAQIRSELGPADPL